MLTLNPYEARTAVALFERLFPKDDISPGATEIGVLEYLDLALAGAYQGHVESYRLGLGALDRVAMDRCATAFADCRPEQQDELIAGMERGELPGFAAPPQQTFFELVRAHLQ